MFLETWYPSQELQLSATTTHWDDNALQKITEKRKTSRAAAVNNNDKNKVNDEDRQNRSCTSCAGCIQRTRSHERPSKRGDGVSTQMRPWWGVISEDTEETTTNYSISILKISTIKTLTTPKRSLSSPQWVSPVTDWNILKPSTIHNP